MGGPSYLITSGFRRCFSSTSSVVPAGAVDNLGGQTEGKVVATERFGKICCSVLGDMASFGPLEGPVSPGVSRDERWPTLSPDGASSSPQWWSSLHPQSGGSPKGEEGVNLVACAHHRGAVPVSHPPRTRGRFQPLLENAVSLCSFGAFQGVS